MTNTKSWLQKQEQEHIRMQKIAREEILRQSTVWDTPVFPDNGSGKYKYKRRNKEIELYVHVDDKNGNIVVQIDERGGSTKVRILSEKKDYIGAFYLYENFEPKAIAEIAKYKYIAILKDKEIAELKRKAKIWDIKV